MSKHTCPRRIEQGLHQTDSVFKDSGPNLDGYGKRNGPVGQKRGCTYCGSMHPDDFMQAIRDGLEIGPTDKGYKFYVDGHAGKFYTQHLSEEQGWEFDRLWKAGSINWGYPGRPYVALFIPGPSTAPKTEEGS